MPILTWEYYRSLHTIVSEENFCRSELLAEKELRNAIGFIHWGELIEGNDDLKMEPFYEQLLDCICNVIDYQATAGKKLGRGISSASNDGYSEAYAIKTASEAQEELQKNIRTWLSGTGLIGAY